MHAKFWTIFGSLTSLSIFIFSALMPLYVKCGYLMAIRRVRFFIFIFATGDYSRPVLTTWRGVLVERFLIGSFGIWNKQWMRIWMKNQNLREPEKE